VVTFTAERCSPHQIHQIQRHESQGSSTCRKGYPDCPMITAKNHPKRFGFCLYYDRRTPYQCDCAGSWPCTSWGLRLYPPTVSRYVSDTPALTVPKHRPVVLLRCQPPPLHPPPPSHPPHPLATTSPMARQGACQWLAAHGACGRLIMPLLPAWRP
jgi:hypothetical protein